MSMILDKVLHVGLRVEYSSNEQWADAVELALEDAQDILDNSVVF
jgi:hypothetical protein